MTQADQLMLANEKISRWTSKHAHAAAMLGKWQKQLAKLQGAKPAEPTINKLPPLVVVPSTDAKVVPIGQAKAKPSPKGKPKK